ncbi:MAG: hypothetical protein IH851_08510 [Armatimonadetes bacterium]|nr:hypothetical protein [Armatimonadota bacterium]
MADIGYVREKMSGAVRTMARGEGGLRPRLFDAYLAFHTLGQSDFPTDEMRRDFDWIMEALTEHKEPDTVAQAARQGHVQYTLGQVSDARCSEIAERIIALESKVSYWEPERADD